MKHQIWIVIILALIIANAIHLWHLEYNNVKLRFLLENLSQERETNELTTPLPSK